MNRGEKGVKNQRKDSSKDNDDDMRDKNRKSKERRKKGEGSNRKIYRVQCDGSSGAGIKKKRTER